MKIGSAAYPFKNNDVPFNLGQIEAAMRQAQGKIDLLCFGEAFLQGFDALCWDYEQDKETAVSLDSAVMAQLCAWTRLYHVDLAVGYIERAGGCIYSSYAVLENGALLHNYRRISRGWKEYERTDDHYREGTVVESFLYRGREMTVALCGDLWEYPERFQTGGILLWPVYVNFTLDEWAQYEKEYAAQAYLSSEHTLMINSMSEAPLSYGGAFHFYKGSIVSKTAYGRPEILVVEL